SRTKMEGHSVRATYAASGATDYYLETGDTAFGDTLENLWRDMTGRKMYLTGGIGSRAQGEAFGEPYELPNLLAYTESCAAIGNMMWNWRMLAATAEARFADTLERALYNGVNSGMSVSGTLYCYRNPLELAGNPADKIRNPWYTTTCCPPNLERVLASLPGYFYSVSKEGVYVHLFHSGELDWKLGDGTPLKIRQTTKYPWEGDVEIAVDPAESREFTMFIRVPLWAGGARLTVNGRPSAAAAGTYAAVRRAWRAGDRIRLQFPLDPRVTSANPLVRDNTGRVAIERGPLVYCMEGLDQPALSSVFDAAVIAGNGFVPEFRTDLLGGAVVLRHRGAAWDKPLADLSLYGPPSRLPGLREAELVFIPYYLFANREPTSMKVWVPVAASTPRKPAARTR
ncbi:MAG TPA: beta-L-arabinofuranosidase domain-containing protein, partial [Bryobacteraceae bacterium]|nr:beta-L-arabinofuranosidase domain-containing protein [Bryobacteraceae bacterium]